MRAQQLFIGIMMVCLLMTACQPAAQTAAPTAAPPPTSPPPTAAVISEAQRLQILADLLGGVAAQEYAFLQDDAFLAWLKEGTPPSPVAPDLSAPQTIAVPLSTGAVYEFVLYQPARAPAAAVVVYFPIWRGLEADEDVAAWLKYLELAPSAAAVPPGVFKLASPSALQADGAGVAFLGFRGFPECLGNCSTALVDKYTQEWIQNFSEMITVLQQKIANGEIPGVDGQTPLITAGKSMGGAFAIEACNLLSNCAQAIVNAPWNGLKTKFVNVPAASEAMQQAGKRVDIYSYEGDPALKDFQGTRYNVVTRPGKEHGVPLADLLGWSEFALYCPAGRADAALAEKKALLEQKKGELDVRRKGLAELANAILAGDHQKLAQLALGMTAMGTAGMAIDAKEITAEMSPEAQQEIKAAWVNFANQEAETLKALQAEVQQLEQEVKRLEQQAAYAQRFCK